MKVNNESQLIGTYCRAEPDKNDTRSSQPAPPPKPRTQRHARQADTGANRRSGRDTGLALQREFRPIELPSRDASQALAEFSDAMTAVTGRHNLREYPSLKSLTTSLTSREGKLLTRRIKNALTETERIMHGAYKRLTDQHEKQHIIGYLATALATDNAVALEEAYQRLRNTAFQGYQRFRSFKSADWNTAVFFERRDKGLPLPDSAKNAPLVFASPKSPRKIAINLEAFGNEVQQLSKKQSSDGFNRELVDALMGQLTRLDGNTQDAVPLRREQTDSGFSLGSAQTALDDFHAVYSGAGREADQARFRSDPVYRADEMTANTDSATIYLRDIGLVRASGESVVGDLLDKDDMFASFRRLSVESKALYSRFPDAVRIAQNIARNKLRERTGLDLDPHDVYLHQFEKSQTKRNPLAYTGYEHYGKPTHSETLTHAYLDNFKIFRNRESHSLWYTLSVAAGKAAAAGTYPSHLDNRDLQAPFFSGPDTLTGLYTVGADAGKFGPGNEIKYLPSDLKNDIFDANVMRQVESTQKDFWRDSTAAWRSLAKGQFIEEARRGLLNGTLSKEGYETAIKGAAANIVMYDPVTMDELEESAAPDPDVKLNFVSVKIPAYIPPNRDFFPDPFRTHFTPYNFFYKTNILCMTGKDGREVLYVPGDEQPFWEFANRNALDRWFMKQVVDDSARSAFLDHVSLANRQGTVEPALKELALGAVRRDLRPALAKSDIGTLYGRTDAFSALAYLTEQRAAADADTLIHSNGEVRLQSARNALELVNLLATPVLPILGPIGVALDIGLAAAQLGVGAGIALTADTPQEQAAAMADAKLGLLFLGINAGLAAKFTAVASRRRPPTVRLADHQFLKTGRSLLEKRPLMRSFGENLTFPWIDDKNGMAEAALRRTLAAKGPGAARLAEFSKNPRGLCYDAAAEVFDVLKKEGEKPKAIGMLIYRNPWDEGPSNHFATLVKKGDADFVVDPTIRQFDSSLPQTATVMPLEQWKSFFRNKAGGNDAVVVLDTYEKLLDAKIAVSEMQNVAGKYYQTRMIRAGGVNVLKYSDKFENSIIAELRKNENILGVMRGEIVDDVLEDVRNLRKLKERFGLLSPQEIRPSATIRGKLRSELLKYAMDDADIGAFNAPADEKGVVTTVSGKRYIKLGKNAFVNFSYHPSNRNAGEISGSMGRNRIRVRFDEQAERWVATNESSG